jgi:hypothetical protein
MIVFTCPGCGKSFHVDEGLTGRRSRCKQCGNVTRIPAADLPVALGPRLRAVAAPKVAVRRRTRVRKPRAIDRDAWISIAIGSGLAAVALAVPLVGFVPDVLKTVIHELGHAATAWFFGSPALPSFDLTYGGGISHLFTRQPLVILLVYAGWACAMYRVRDDWPVLIVVLTGVVVYSAVVFTSLRELITIAMGHGAELLAAGVFLYRALSGSQILRGEERPLYAFLGLYIVLSDSRFAYRLITSAEHRETYGDAKGGGHWMDFSRIADEHLHCRLEAVATIFLLACALAPLAAFLTHRYQRRRQ